MKNKKAIEIIQKSEKVIYKIRYVLEMIFSIIAIFASYKVVTIKHYFGYFHKTYLIIACMYCILALSCLIYCCYKDKKIIEKMFLAFAIPVGIMYIVFIVPSYAPDEHAHMWKAYEVSTGKLVTKIEEDGTSSSQVPKDLIKYSPSEVGKYIKLIGMISGSTNYEDTVTLTSPAQSYSFILYIGSSIGFLISRIFSLNILIGIYLGRIINLILFLLAGYYMIKIIPFGKLLMTSYLFMPMVLQQAVSFSADSITNIVVLLFIAYILKLIFQKEKIKIKQDIILCVLSILVGIVKIVYVPILGLILMLIFKNNMTKKEKAIVIPTCIILGGIVSIATYLFSTQYVSPNMIPYYEENNVNASEQISYIIHNPINVLKTIKNDWYNKGEVYIDTLIGSSLGWLNIAINRPIIVLFLLTILYSAIVEKNKVALNKKQKIWTAILAVGSIVIIELAMYISWTGVGASSIEGIQGRYFVPIGILLLLTLCMKNNYLKYKNVNIKIPLIVTMLNLFTIKTIYTFFI